MKTGSTKFGIFSLLAMAFFLCGTLPVFSDIHALTLSLADSTAPVGLRGEGVRFLVEEIEKHTGGKVKVQVHWGSSLLKEKEILSGIQDGVVDIGYLNPNYYPTQMRVSGAFSLFPKGPKKFRNISWFYAQSYEQIPELKEELERLKLKAIYINTILPVAIVSTKPFTSFEDFKGKKIRSASRWALAQLEGAGAIPVSIPWGDCYMALQTGTIDAVFTNRDGEHRTKLDEVAPHIYAMKQIWVSIPFIYAMNIDRWNDLSPELQQQIIAAGNAAVLRFEELWEGEWAKVDAAQRKMKTVITDATPADIEKWATMPVIRELQQVWVKEATAAGVKNADRVLPKMEALLEKAAARD